MYFYGKQSICENDIKAVTNVLKSNFLTQGPKVEEFEGSLANYTGAKYSVAFSNATTALQAICSASGVSKDSLVWTSANSFLASSNCALYLGAQVDFVDIQLKDGNVCPEKLLKKIKNSKLKPDVFIPVHFAGIPCDMKKIKEICDQYNIKVIEDAAHALGAVYNEKKIGSCQYSEAAVFSFHPVKMITSGEGGAVLTNSYELKEKLLQYRSHGMIKDQALVQKKSKLAPWYYEMQSLGHNFRITDMQCALGVSQLSKLDDYLKRRRYIASFYKKNFNENNFEVLEYDKEICNPSWHLFQVKLPEIIKHGEKVRMYDLMKKKGLTCHVHYIPIPSQPYYESLGFNELSFPQALKHYEQVFSLPIYYSLNDEDLKKIIEIFISSYHELSR